MAGLNQVTLYGTGITTTALGFGCNDLLGNKTQSQGLLLLEAAYDAGVRHFDVARKYNFGEAETLVGLFAQGRRDRLTITTKFGMQPPANLAQNKDLIQVLRGAVRSSPFLRKLATRGAKAMTRGKKFDVPTAQASLEKSLTELKTDYIDVYLLHECVPSDCSIELLGFLEDAKRAGKIRAFGVGTSVAHTREISGTAEGFASVLQFKHTILDPDLEKVFTEKTSVQTPRAIITHGAISILEELIVKSQKDRNFTAALSECFGLDPKDRSALAGLLLQQALFANPNGIVLFRSADPNRIASNVKAALEAKFSAASFKRFAEIIAG